MQHLIFVWFEYLIENFNHPKRSFFVFSATKQRHNQQKIFRFKRTNLSDLLKLSDLNVNLGVCFSAESLLNATKYRRCRSSDSDSAASTFLLLIFFLLCHRNNTCQCQKSVHCTIKPLLSGRCYHSTVKTRDGCMQTHRVWCTRVSAGLRFTEILCATAVR